MDIVNEHKNYSLLIKFLNYGDLNHLIELGILLQPNPLITEIFKHIFTHENSKVSLDGNLRQRILDKEIPIEDPLTLSLLKEEYNVYVENMLDLMPFSVAKLAENLNLLYKNKEFKLITNFVVEYSRHQAVDFILSDNFQLKVKVKIEDEEDFFFMEQAPSIPKKSIKILFVSKTKNDLSFDLKIYKAQIDYIINIYKQKLGDSYEVSCNMSNIMVPKNNPEFILFLEQNYDLKILESIVPQSLGERNAFLQLFKIRYLGVRFENYPAKLTCDKKIEFESVEREEIGKLYFDD